MIKELIIKKVLTDAFSNLVERLKKEVGKPKIQVTKGDLVDALSNHLKYVELFSSNVQIKEMLKARSLSEIYVNLDIRLSPKRWGVSSKKISTIKISNIFDDGFHAIILGEPGAGKTTSSKKICQLLLHSEEEFGGFNFPILIRLRDLKPRETVTDRLASILSFTIKISQAEDSEHQIDAKNLLKKHLFNYLEDLKAIVVLDGLDEVPDKKQNLVVQEFTDLVLNLDKSKVLITSRSGAFDLTIQNATVFEICPLSPTQINSFIDSWFSKKRFATKFKKDLSLSPFQDTLIKPLNLTYLCALFERDHKIPEQPKIVYKKIIRLLLEDWDKQNSLKRETRFSHLDLEERYDFFCHLSFSLSSAYSEKVYSEDMIRKVYKEIYARFNLSYREMRNVIEELESHHGIFIKSSYDTYEFYHKSIQEFFCAEFVVKLPYIPINLNFVSEYAVATSLSPDPNRFFCSLLLELMDLRILNKKFFEQLILRIVQEKIVFTKDPLFITALFNAYSYLYIEVLSTSNLYRSTENLDAELGSGSIVSEIFHAFKRESYFLNDLLDIQDSFDVIRINSPGILTLAPKKTLLEQLEKLMGSKYANMLENKIRIKEDFID